MNPVAFKIANFEIRWYSILIAAAVLISYIMVNSECKKFQIKKERVHQGRGWFNHTEKRKAIGFL